MIDPQMGATAHRLRASACKSWHSDLLCVYYLSTASTYGHEPEGAIMASIKFPTFPAVDLSALDMSRLNFSTLSFPKVNVADIDTEAVTDAAKDVAYVTIGLAVVAFQKAQVRRREITKSFSDQAADIESRIDSFEVKIDEAVVELEKRLPVRAGSMLAQAHDIAKTARQQVRGRIFAAA